LGFAENDAVKNIILDIIDKAYHKIFYTLNTFLIFAAIIIFSPAIILEGGMVCIYV